MNGSNRKTYTAAGLGLLAVLFVSSIMLSNLALDNMRLDLTEQKLYTMSEGTLKVIDSIQQPINLYLFFSDRASAENAHLRNYARRVRELLEEYNALLGRSVGPARDRSGTIFGRGGPGDGVQPAIAPGAGWRQVVFRSGWHERGG